MKGVVTLKAVAVCLLLLHTTVTACPTCYGAPGSPMTDGMNMAILSLLGITGGVLTGVIGFFLYMRRRTMMLNRLFSNRLN